MDDHFQERCKKLKRKLNKDSNTRKQNFRELIKDPDYVNTLSYLKEEIDQTIDYFDEID